MSWKLIWKEHSKGHTCLVFKNFWDARSCMDKLYEAGKYNDFQLQEIPDKDE